MVALETGFNVTDTFHIAFAKGVIVDVQTSPDDQPIYTEAKKCVEENLPQVMQGPCKREEGFRVTPRDCARAMTDGYRQFMDVMKAEETHAFIPDEFEPTVLVEVDGFILIPLGPALAEIDHAAYLSSIEHLQEPFTRSESCPHADIDDEAALQDTINEEARFNARESFDYAVLTPDGERERGCVYVRPTLKPGFDAEVSPWVTKAEFDAGFDEKLYAWTV